MKKKIEFRTDVISEYEEVKFIEIQGDYYQLQPFEDGEKKVFYVFNHDLPHSRLDVSCLRGYFLIFFDKNNETVGGTICSTAGPGKYILHNKQRMFLLMKIEDVDSLKGLASIKVF